MYLGTNFTPPVIHPTQQIVNHTFSTTVVPHIHPVHETMVNHHMFQHKHYCPETASCAEEVCNQHINCCNPCAPAAALPVTLPAAMPPSNALPNMPPVNAPGMGMGGPGFGPGGPGFAPVGPGFGPAGPGFAPGGPGFAPGGPGFAPGPFMGPRR